MLIDAIAIDFDATFTSDECLWYNVIKSIQIGGYKVICATARSWSEREEHDLTEALPHDVKIVFCGNKFKREACEAAGYNVTIWIDDCPSGIDRSSGIVWIERIKSFLHTIKDKIFNV
jgi:hypothetical protein